jgi:hypothetical protein
VDSQKGYVPKIQGAIMADYVPVASKEINLSADRLSTNATFDAVLSKPTSGMDMYKLTIKLRISLQQAYQLPPVVMDGNDKPFWIKPWTGPEWHTFVNGVQGQANLWNNRFWLKPPSDFTDYDLEIMSTNSSFRPYIACELDVDFNADNADAHKTITVYNLDLAKITGNQDSNTFRSDTLHYDSLDATPWVTRYLDDAGNPVKHYTVAHEIGHAIGQPHIGVMRKTPLCQMSMNVGGLDGQNASVCYANDLPDLGGNVMGGGGLFTVDNGISWKWAILMLSGKAVYQDWQVLASKPSKAGEFVTRMASA